MSEIKMYSPEQTPEKAPEMVTIPELVRRTDFSDYGIRKLCRNGVIHSVKVGNKTLINYDRFIDYLNNRQ